jgi:gamma-glutamylcyclotransferase (GGCT)/AIG2-like uncharacterized protein YtfP
MPDGPVRSGRAGVLRVFVYGTLMPGQVNHPRFCHGARDAGPATLRGHIYHLPAGYPAARVEPAEVLEIASGDLAQDLRLQRRWDARLTGEAPVPASGSGGVVHGEWIRFDDGEARLRRLDWLEGFVPGGGGLYDRVLVRITSADRRSLAAWTYVQAEPRGTPLPHGRWPG